MNEIASFEDLFRKYSSMAPLAFRNGDIPTDEVTHATNRYDEAWARRMDSRMLLLEKQMKKIENLLEGIILQ
jgi:hypothetical protein